MSTPTTPTSGPVPKSPPPSITGEDSAAPLIVAGFDQSHPVPSSQRELPPPTRSPGDQIANRNTKRTGGARLAASSILVLVAAAVAVILLSPVTLSSRDLLSWASTPTGLNLPDRWAVLVILSLDAPAIACVLMSVLCTWRGERPGIFAVLIWAFAGASALANWRHASNPAIAASAPDAAWFYPAMSLTGPGILEAVLHRVRAWIHADTAAPPTPTALRRRPAWQRWIPGLGSFTDTFGATRTRLLLGLDTFAEALTEYHHLCPDGSLRVAAAIRVRHQARTYADLQSALDRVQHASAGDVCAGVSARAFRRLPIDTGAYQHAQRTWKALRNVQDSSGDLHGTGLRDFLTEHHLSRRQLQFIRQWGAAGMLDFPISPRAIAELATGQTRPGPATTSQLSTT